MKYIGYKILALIGTIIVLSFFIGKFQKNAGLDVKITLETSKHIGLQIFYSSEKGGQFTEEESVRFELPKTEGMEQVTLTLNVNTIKELRIDLGEVPGKLKIKKIEINGRRNIKILADKLLNLEMNQITNSSIADNILIIETDELDPYIVFNGETIENENYISYDYLQIFIFIVVFYFMFYKLLLYIKMKKNESNWIKLLFIFLVYFIFLFPIFKIDNYENDMIENRNLAKKPSVMKEEGFNLNFGKEAENWLNDHFYQRKTIIKYYKKISQKISGKVENDSTMLGKEGWLFYKKDNSITNFQNINLYSQEDLERIEEKLMRKQIWLEKQGIKYYIMIAPDKNKIYGEFYPSYIKKVNEKGKAQQLIDHLEKNNKVNIIYPYDQLMKEKSKGYLYWKDDTHWNEYGGFIGYTTLMNKIKIDFPNIQIRQENDYSKIEDIYTNEGLRKMLSISDDKYSTTRYYRFIPKSGYNFILTKLNNEDVNFIPDKDFNFYLEINGTGNLSKSSNELKVLVFHDSFMKLMVQYISDTFGEVEYIWDDNLNNYQEKIINEKPDIVIQELVERYIDALEKDEPKLREVD